MKMSNCENKHLNLNQQLEQAKKNTQHIAEMSTKLAVEEKDLNKTIVHCKKKLSVLAVDIQKQLKAIETEKADIKKRQQTNAGEEKQLMLLEAEIEDYKKQQTKYKQWLKDELKKSKFINLEVFTSSKCSNIKKENYVKIDGRNLKLRTIQHKCPGLLMAFINLTKGRETFFGLYFLDAVDELQSKIKKIKRLCERNPVFVASSLITTSVAPIFSALVSRMSRSSIFDSLNLGSQKVYLGIKNKSDKKNPWLSDYFIAVSDVPPQETKEHASSARSARPKTFCLPTPKREAVAKKRIENLESVEAKEIKEYLIQKATIETKIKKQRQGIVKVKNTLRNHQLIIGESRSELNRLKTEKKCAETRQEEKELMLNSTKISLMSHKTQEEKLKRSLDKTPEPRACSDAQEKQEKLVAKTLQQLRKQKKKRTICEKSLVETNKNIAKLEESLKQVAPQVERLKRGKEKEIRDLEQEKEGINKDRAYLNETLKDILDLKLLINDKALTGYVSEEPLPEANQFIIAILQFIHERYAFHYLPLEGAKNYPVEWKDTIGQVLESANVSSTKPLTLNAAKKLVGGINRVYASDHIQVAVNWHHDGEIMSLGNTTHSNLSVDVLHYQQRFLGIVDSRQFYTEASRAKLLFQQLIASFGLLRDLCGTRCGIIPLKSSTNEVMSSQSLSDAFDIQLEQCKEEKNFQAWCAHLKEEQFNPASKAALAVQVLHWLAIYERRHREENKTAVNFSFHRFTQHYERTLSACVKDEFKRRQEDCQSAIDVNSITRLEAEIRAKKQAILKTKNACGEERKTIKKEEQEIEELRKEAKHVDLVYKLQLGSLKGKLKKLEKKRRKLNKALSGHKKRGEQTSSEIKQLNKDRDNTDDQTAKLREEEADIREKLSGLEKKNQRFKKTTAAKKKKKATQLNRKKSILLDKAENNAEIYLLESKLDFIKATQKAIADDKQFFHKRATLRPKIDSFLNRSNPVFFRELYPFMTGSGWAEAGLTQLKLDKFKKLEELLDQDSAYCPKVLEVLKQAIQKPRLDPHPSEAKLEISGQNVSWEDCAEALLGEMKKQLHTLGLDVNEEEKLYVKDKALLGGDITAFPEKLQPLFKQHIRTQYHYDKRQGGWPEEKKTDNDLVELIANLNLDLYDVLAVYYKTINIVTGNHLYIDDNITLPGINLFFFSNHKIFLEKDCKIDTSGKDAPKYKYKKARNGEFYREDKNTPSGENGDSGENGYAGQNAGHVFIKARDEIANLDSLQCKAIGGDGADGQVGGDGDQGDKGSKTPDAEADDTGHWCEQSFLATARFSAIGRGGKLIRGERSEPGGHAGLTGIGGSGGHVGDVILEDKRHTIQCLNGNEEIEIQSSIEPATLKKHLLAHAGMSGKDLKECGKGGEAGKAGLMGLDESHSKKGFWHKTKDRQGQLDISWVQNLSAISANDSAENDLTIMGAGMAGAAGAVGFVAAGVLSGGLVPVLCVAGTIFYGFLRGLGFLDRDTYIRSDSDRYQQQLEILHGSYDPLEEFNRMSGKERRSPYEKSRGKKGNDGQQRDKSTRNQPEKNSNASRENQEYRQTLQTRANRLYQSAHQTVANLKIKTQHDIKTLTKKKAELDNKIQAFDAAIQDGQQRLNELNKASAEIKTHSLMFEQKLTDIAQEIKTISEHRLNIGQKLRSKHKEESKHQSKISAIRVDINCADIDVDGNLSLQQRIGQLKQRLHRMIQLVQESKNETILQRKDRIERLISDIKGLEKEIEIMTSRDEKLKKDKKQLKKHIEHVSQANLSHQESTQTREQVQVAVEYEGNKNQKRLALNSDQLGKNSQASRSTITDTYSHHIYLNGDHLHKAYEQLVGEKPKANEHFVTLLSSFSEEFVSLTKTKPNECFSFLRAFNRYVGEEMCSTTDIIKLWKQLDDLIGLIESSCVSEGRTELRKCFNDLYFIVNKKSMVLFEQRCQEGINDTPQENIQAKLQKIVCDVNVFINIDVVREVQIKNIFYRSVFSDNNWRGEKLMGLLRFSPAIHVYSFEKEKRPELLTAFKGAAKFLGVKVNERDHVDNLYVRCILALVDLRVGKGNLFFDNKLAFYKTVKNLFGAISSNDVSSLPEKHLLKQWFYFLRDESLASEMTGVIQSLLTAKNDAKKLAEKLLSAHGNIKRFSLDEQKRQTVMTGYVSRLNLELYEKTNCIQALLAIDKTPLFLVNILFSSISILTDCRIVEEKGDLNAVTLDDTKIDTLVRCIEDTGKRYDCSDLYSARFLNREIRNLLHSRTGGLFDFDEKTIKLCLKMLQKSVQQLLQLQTILSLPDMLSAIFVLLNIKNKHMIQSQKMPLFEADLKKEKNCWKSKSKNYLIKQFDIKQESAVFEKTLFSGMLAIDDEEKLARYFNGYLYCMDMELKENNVAPLFKLEKAIIATKPHVLKNENSIILGLWLDFFSKTDHFINLSYLNCLEGRIENIQNKIEAKKVKPLDLESYSQNFSQYFTVHNPKLRAQKERMVEFLIKKIFLLEEPLPESHAVIDLISKVNNAGWTKLKNKKASGFLGASWTNLPDTLSSEEDLEQVFSSWNNFMKEHKGVLAHDSGLLSPEFKNFVNDSRALFRAILFNKPPHQAAFCEWSKCLKAAIKNEFWQTRTDDIKVLENLYGIVECAAYQKDNYTNVSDLADDFEKQDLSQEQSKSFYQFKSICRGDLWSILSTLSFVSDPEQTREVFLGKIEKILTKEQFEEHPLLCIKKIQELMSKEKKALIKGDSLSENSCASLIKEHSKTARNQVGSKNIGNTIAMLKSLICLLVFNERDLDALKLLLPVDQWSCYQSPAINFYINKGFQIANEKAQSILLDCLIDNQDLYPYKQQLDKIMQSSLAKQRPRQYTALWIKLGLAAQRKEKNFDSVIRELFSINKQASISWNDIKQAMLTQDSWSSPQKMRATP
jgi:hypothetical protein